MKKKVLFLATFLIAIAFVFVGCKTTTEEQTTTTTTTAATVSEEQTTMVNRVTNDSYTLLIQSSTMDGVFNPFFYSSAYDGDVIGLVNVGLLTTDETGAVVAGDYYPTVAKSYSIYYTDNLTTYAEKENYVDGDYVVYEIVLKNDAKFSDGSVITADDVLFNYYVYLDPAYIGSSTLYTLPILGLTDYRTQVPNSASYENIINTILADDDRVTGYVQNDVYTEEQFDSYWAGMYAAGEVFAQEIVDYVNVAYADDYYVNKYFDATLTYDEIAASDQLMVAYGMGMWGYGEISADHLTFTGASGTEYDVADLTAAVYFDEILLANSVDDKIESVYADGYQGLSDYESAGSDFVTVAKESFLSAYKEVGSVQSITGLVKGTTTIDGETYETVKVVLTEQNPKAILSLGVTVTPQHYYTAGYTYIPTKIHNYGVEFNTPQFIEHLQTFNAAPMGAGPYKFLTIDEGDGTVYFERNIYFETMGGTNVYNTNIKYVALKIVESGAEYNALVAGDVHYATVSATADVMEDVADNADLEPILVDNLGYGYICINPTVWPNLNFRIALTTVFDMQRVLDYYPNGLADLITRAQSQVSWAYPEGADYIYPYDETLVSAISYFEAAGYTYTDGAFTDVPVIDFYLPSDAANHPAGGIFIKAQTLLATIGIESVIQTDTSLIAHTKSGQVGVYALAWQSSQDPDMYQVYHYLSQAESVIANGIAWLHENGNDDTLGTIDVAVHYGDQAGTTVTMNQSKALEYLAYLIEQGTKYMLTEERAPIYAEALQVLAQLNIEVPTYQRKNLFIYNETVIDSTTLSSSVTPYWGPLAEIWKLSFASGVEGNETVSVSVPVE